MWKQLAQWNMLGRYLTRRKNLVPSRIMVQMLFFFCWGWRWENFRIDTDLALVRYYFCFNLPSKFQIKKPWSVISRSWAVGSDVRLQSHQPRGPQHRLLRPDRWLGEGHWAHGAKSGEVRRGGGLFILSLITIAWNFSILESKFRLTIFLVWFKFNPFSLSWGFGASDDGVKLNVL